MLVVCLGVVVWCEVHVAEVNFLCDTKCIMSMPNFDEHHVTAHF